MEYILGDLKILQHLLTQSHLYQAIGLLGYCTDVRFASFLSGGFITAIVVISSERRLTKCTSVH